MNHHHLSEKPAHLFNDQREAHRPLISNCYFFFFLLSQWISRCEMLRPPDHRRDEPRLRAETQMLS